MSFLAAALGTLILFLPTSHGLYVAADSRNDGGDAAQADEAQKIFLCGTHGVCAISGAMRLTVTKKDGTTGELDVAEALRKAARDAPAAGVPAFLSERMNAAIAEFWRQHMNEPVGTRLTARLLAPSVCTILVATAESGPESARLDQIQFPFVERANEDGTFSHELQQPVIRQADPKRPLAQGKTDCMKITADMPPAIETREETLTTIRALYERTQYDPYCKTIIGGPVDIAVILPDGAHWLRRKGERVASAAGGGLLR